MELEKWWVLARSEANKYMGTKDVSDYDSTLAALDELEDRLTALEGWSQDVDVHVCDGGERRLTALEKRIKSNDIEMCDGLTQLEDAIIKLEDHLAALEADSKNTLETPITETDDPNLHKPTATCGTCAKAARWDESPDTVVCDQDSREEGLHYKSVQTKACPYHEWRV